MITKLNINVKYIIILNSQLLTVNYISLAK